MEERNYTLAAQLYTEAIDASEDEFAPLGRTAIPGLTALSRFRLMLTYLQLGTKEQAIAMYQDAQQKDGDYAVLSKVFWRAYERGDLRQGCTTAIADARTHAELWQPLTELPVTYAGYSFRPEDLCPTDMQ